MPCRNSLHHLAIANNHDGELSGQPGFSFLTLGEVNPPCLSTASTDPFGLSVAVLLEVYAFHEVDAFAVSGVQIRRRNDVRFVRFEVLDDLLEGARNLLERVKNAKDPRFGRRLDPHAVVELDFDFIWCRGHQFNSTLALPPGASESTICCILKGFSFARCMIFIAAFVACASERASKIAQIHTSAGALIVCPFASLMRTWAIRLSRANSTCSVTASRLDSPTRRD